MSTEQLGRFEVLHHNLLAHIRRQVEPLIVELLTDYLTKHRRWYSRKLSVSLFNGPFKIADQEIRAMSTKIFFAIYDLLPSAMAHKYQLAAVLTIRLTTIVTQEKFPLFIPAAYLEANRLRASADARNN